MIQPDSSFCTVVVFELTLAVFFPWKHEGSGDQKKKRQDRPCGRLPVGI